MKLSVLLWEEMSFKKIESQDKEIVILPQHLDEISEIASEIYKSKSPKEEINNERFRMACLFAALRDFMGRRKVESRFDIKW